MPNPPVLPDLPPQTPQPQVINPGRSTIRWRGLNGQVEAADRKPLPVVYGLNWLDGRVGPIRVLSGANNELVAAYFYCIGEINAIKKVYVDNRNTSIWDDGAHASSKTVTFPEDGSLTLLYMTQYHGTTTQAVDTSLSTRFPGYADTCVYSESNQSVGQVYIVVVQKGPGFDTAIVPRIVVEGLKVFDPRTSTTIYSTNPALFLADFLSQPYGAGMTVDWDSVEVVADFCDELVNLKKRFWGGAAITDTARIDQHIERLRAIAGCMVRVEGATAYLVKNDAAASVFTFNTSNIVAGSLRFGHKRQIERPTRVEVEYTKTAENGTDLIPWKRDVAVYEHPDVDLGTLPRRTMKIPLWDAQSHEVAYRYALQEYRLRETDRWLCSLKTRDMIAASFQGEVVTVNHDDLVGSSMAFRITRIRENRSGGHTTYDVDLDYYDGSVYSDDDVTDTQPVLPTNVDPDDPPAVASVTAQEVIAPDQSGVMRSRIEVTFSPIEWPAVKHYRVAVVGPGVLFRWTEPPTVRDIVTTSPDLSGAEINDPTGEVFLVKVRVVSTTNEVSTATRAFPRVLGKYAPPPDIPGFIRIFHVDGVTIAELQTVVDIGVVRYLLRYAFSDVGWDSAFRVNNAPSASNIIEHRVYQDDTSDEIFYYAKAIDSSGVESVNALQASINVDSTSQDDYREVVFDFESSDTAGGHAFFVYGAGDYKCKFAADATWSARIGTTATPWRNEALHWYDMTGLAGNDPAATIEATSTTFDLGADAMRSTRVNAEHWRYEVSPASRAPDINALTTHIDSDAQIERTAIATGAFNRVARWAWFDFDDNTTLTDDEYLEIRFPVTVSCKRIVRKISGTQSGLDETSLPYSVIFDAPYLGTPFVRVNAISSSTITLIVTALSSSGFTVAKASGPSTFSWTISWDAEGE